MLITTALAARRLGVAHERLLDWVARKLLPIAGEDEEGRVLLREHVVQERGEALANEVPERLRSPRLRCLAADPTPARVLHCGCVFEAYAQPDAEPLFRCAEARALDATARLAEAFAATVPGDLFFGHLAKITRDAFARHFRESGGPPGAAPRPDDPSGTHLQARVT